MNDQAKCEPRGEFYKRIIAENEENIATVDGLIKFFEKSLKSGPLEGKATTEMHLNNAKALKAKLEKSIEDINADIQKRNAAEAAAEAAAAAEAEAGNGGRRRKTRRGSKRSRTTRRRS